MADVLEMVADFSYFGIFLVMIGINASPILMPPSWIILTSFYLIDPALDVVVLAAVGATGATMGRLALMRFSGIFRRFVGKEQRENLDVMGGYLNGRRYGYALASFLFGATPLPSNMLFVAYGLLRARNIGIYAGFWAGRLISYIVMIHFGNAALRPLLEIFEDRMAGIILIDAAGIATIALFASINWVDLITKRRLRFVRPRIWRL